MDIRETLSSQARALGVKLHPEQAQAFQAYMELLLEWNAKINLTAITQPEEIVKKHFLDSLTLLSACPIKQGAKIVDVGTGAGFPGIPLKLVRPDIQLTLLDSQHKRLQFLGVVCEALGIEATRVHKRAEEAGRDTSMRESFDVVTARAVAPFPVLCEYCIPLMKMKGFFVAMKGPGAESERAAAQRALDILGGDEAKIVPVEDFGAGERNLIVARKKRFTPKGYPRHGGTISKHPL